MTHVLPMPAREMSDPMALGILRKARDGAKWRGHASMMMPRRLARPLDLRDALAARELDEHDFGLRRRKELKRLEALLQKTPEGSPDFLIVLRRLGDGYAELEVLAERERAKASAAADDAERAAREAPKKKLVRGTGTMM